MILDGNYILVGNSLVKNDITILLVPGLGGSEPNHWQSILVRSLIFNMYFEMEEGVKYEDD